MNEKLTEMGLVRRTGPNLGTGPDFGTAGPVRTGPSAISVYEYWLIGSVIGSSDWDLIADPVGLCVPCELLL